MAKPAFIYAFDNFPPERFAELCGFLLAERHKGLLLGGVGPDGGIDGEIDNLLGEWVPETISPLQSSIINPKELVVFQFKHKVIGRVGGQVKARQELLTLYKDSPKRPSELNRKLILKKNPYAYVLVTNVEVNAPFRQTFIEECRKVNSSIASYHVIGSDELELWVTSDRTLRHLYFPTIFGVPRFHLDVKLNYGYLNQEDVLIISILNVGEFPSYFQSVELQIIVNDKINKLIFNPYNVPLMLNYNPKPGTRIEPGRKVCYYIPVDVVKNNLRNHKAFPTEFIITDEIDNRYRVEVDDSLTWHLSIDPN